MFNSVENRKRAYLSKDDYNSIISFKCDGCHLLKPFLRAHVDKMGKLFLCEHCLEYV